MTAKKRHGGGTTRRAWPCGERHRETGHLQEELELAEDQVASLTGHLGPLTIRFTGPCTVKPDSPSAGMLSVDFAFDAIAASLGGREFTNVATDGSSKTYTFVAAECEGGALIARSSGGGITLLFQTSALPRKRPNVDFLAIEL